MKMRVVLAIGLACMLSASADQSFERNFSRVFLNPPPTLQQAAIATVGGIAIMVSVEGLLCGVLPVFTHTTYVISQDALGNNPDFNTALGAVISGKYVKEKKRLLTYREGCSLYDAGTMNTVSEKHGLEMGVFAWKAEECIDNYYEVSILSWRNPYMVLPFYAARSAGIVGGFLAYAYGLISGMLVAGEAYYGDAFYRDILPPVK